MAKPKKGETTYKMISERKLKQLMTHARQAKKEVGTINGTYREKVAYAKEHDNLHPKALSICNSLDRLEGPELNYLLACLDFYLDASGLRARAEGSPPLSFDKDGEGEESEEEGETTGGKVHRFPAQTSVAAE